MPSRLILFLCTGNYYRSRYAELYFNQRARHGWQAESRGLRLSPANHGPISASVIARLERRGLAAPATWRPPLAVTPADVEAARRVIALDEAEHRPMVAELLPRSAARVEYWRIADAPVMTVEQALGGIERAVDLLLAELGAL